MKNERSTLTLVAALVALVSVIAEAQPKIAVNYDENKVGQYTLPDPLRLENGQRVGDAKTWNQKRRPEIQRLFEGNVYGRSPGRPVDMSWQIFDEDRHALGGKAIRKQVTIFFGKDRNGPKEDLLIYLPEQSAKSVPLILSLNFAGNHSIIEDPGVKLATLWDRKSKAKQEATEASRGKSKDFQGAVEKALARGYGFATIYYGDIEPDFAGGIEYGVRRLYLKPGQTEPAPDEWGAIAAWGWGLSRALDYMETDKEIDARRVAIMGHSRLGKTVLWAGARDTRFAMVLASCSGEGGASLARRNYGETLKHMNVNFPYQFSRNFQKYGDRVNLLPVDTHELLALIAPRYVYLSTAVGDQWADPRGEFLAAVAAEPVFKLLGKSGLDTDQFPPVNQPIVHDVGFHCRDGKHEVLTFDWEQFLSFADKHLRSPWPTSRTGQL